jgi:hypothetical protein
MSTEHTITVKAQRGDGSDLGVSLTIADLREFLASVEPTAANGALKPKARVSLGGKIKSITVTVPGDTPAT